MIDLLFGHLVGDYLLQNRWMALNKGKNTPFSFAVCVLHCSIYTLAVAVFTCWEPLWLILVFTSHFVIDKFSLGELWLQVINGRSLHQFFIETKAVTPQTAIAASFTALVYTIVDNTLHLLVMVYGARLFGTSW